VTIEMLLNDHTQTNTLPHSLWQLHWTYVNVIYTKSTCALWHKGFVTNRRIL